MGTPNKLYEFRSVTPFLREVIEGKELMGCKPDNGPPLGNKPVPEQVGVRRTPGGSARAMVLDRHAADILAAVLAEIEALKHLSLIHISEPTRPY